MFRSLLSAVSICVLLAATFLASGVVSARRCEVKMPVTLLSLYRTADFVYIGTFDRREEGESIEESNYREIKIKNHFSITSTLKGESRKMVVLEDSHYIYPPQAADASTAEFEAEQEDNEDAEQGSEPSAEAQVSEEDGDGEEAVDVPDEEAEADDEDELEPGDQVILFLDKESDDEGNETVSLTDYQYGLKKMKADSAGSYEARIRELGAIFENKRPTYSDLVAWLVRCAEDPNTRWEGTYELLRSFQTMESQGQQAEELKNKPEPSPSSDGEVIEVFRINPPKEYETGDPGFARALTEAQRLILTDTLMRRWERGTPSKEFGFGDRELVELVSKWGDAKVAVNLLEQLRADPSAPDAADDLMTSIAAIFNDDELSDIASRFADTRWESAEDQVDAEYLEKPEEPGTEDEAVESADSSADPGVQVPEESAGATENANEPETAARPPEVKITYERFRTELVKRFIDRADKLLAKEKKSTARN